jgi:adenylate kinase
MDRNEKLMFQQSIENYFESKHIYDLFEKLLYDLVVNKPTDPYDYLIKRLKIKDNRKIFITGAPGIKRKEIALSLAEHFQYACCSVGDLIEKEISKKLDIGRKCEKKYKSLNFGNI